MKQCEEKLHGFDELWETIQSVECMASELVIYYSLNALARIWARLKKWVGALLFFFFYQNVSGMTESGTCKMQAHHLFASTGKSIFALKIRVFSSILLHQRIFLGAKSINLIWVLCVLFSTEFLASIPILSVFCLLILHSNNSPQVVDRIMCWTYQFYCMHFIVCQSIILFWCFFLFLSLDSYEWNWRWFFLSHLTRGFIW